MKQPDSLTAQLQQIRKALKLPKVICNLLVTEEGVCFIGLQHPKFSSLNDEIESDDDDSLLVRSAMFKPPQGYMG